MKLDTIDAVKKYIIKAGILDKSQKPIVEVLNGGVSCTIWKIVSKDNRWVMKQAFKVDGYQCLILDSRIMDVLKEGMYLELTPLRKISEHNKNEYYAEYLKEWIKYRRPKAINPIN